MSNKLTIHTGDTQPLLSASLLGGPDDWTGATAEVSLGPCGGTPTLYSTGLVLDTAAKTVTWDYTGFDTSADGEYEYTWIITFADSSEMTAPGNGFDYLTIIDESPPAPAETSYVTMKRALIALGISDPTHDERQILAWLIDEASSAVNDFCGRKFYYEAGVQEQFAYNEVTSSYLVRRNPISTVNSITDITDNTTLTVGIDEDFFVQDTDIGQIYFLKPLARRGFFRPSVSQGPLLGAEMRRWRVDYDGGYETPNQTGTGAPALPRSIVNATMMLLSSLFEGEGRSRGILREHLLETSVWYDHSHMNAQLGTMLKAWRRVRSA